MTDPERRSECRRPGEGRLLNRAAPLPLSVSAAQSMSASLRKRPKCCAAANRREWDGPAVLPPLTAHRASLGVFEEHEERTTMPCKTVAIAHTIGIDTGKNTMHMIGLDKKGTIVVREKVSRTRIAARLVNVPQCLIGIEAGMASHHVARELLAL